jgi:hypothetical protein
LATVRTRADDIQRQMAEIRSQLHQDMREVVTVASIATDWRSYLRGYTWLAIGVAFASGYLLVPRRSRTSTVVVQPQAVVEQPRQVVTRTDKAAKSSLIRWALGAIAPIAIRAAQSYALSHIESLVANQQPGLRPGGASRQETLGQPARHEDRGYATRG